ncbi:Arc family DNA-binding protein [Pseudomonas sp. 43(2021)]|uniref:Arc family DNA-binding protein n=1 Tax=Pseudomonas sp. 43(2021) TaxID=2813560 RepID=UPI001A9E8F3F|nr:Arc family DNA-binding protein [Pseudomonas sp. 43(2021)]
MSTSKITTAVRMLCTMRQKLEKRAAENGRSLSGEIVFRLRKSLEEEMQDGQKQRA